MAKPWHWADNRPDTTEEPGDRGAEAGVAVVDVEAGGVTQGYEAAEPPPNKEDSTSGRNAKKQPIVGQRRRRRRMKGKMRKGTGTDIPQ